MNTENIAAQLVKYHVKPSYPRIRIMEYLASAKNHPTVDEIYRELVKEIPTLSKTTVYNTLEIFMDARLARVVTIEENETRYDADITDHGHFKCVKCGEVIDFPVTLDPVTTESLTGFRIDEKNIYFKGVCAKCLLNKESDQRDFA